MISRPGRVVIGYAFLLSAAFVIYRPSLAMSSAASSAELTSWSEFRNRFGWSIRYPAEWPIQPTMDMYDEISPEKSGVVELEGPPGCYESGKRCASVQIEYDWLESTASAASSPKDYLLRDVNGRILSQGSIQLAGREGYQITLLEERSGWDSGMPSKRIAIRDNGHHLRIEYHEDAKERRQIHSASDWTLVSTFEQMLSTLQLLQPMQTKPEL